MVWSAEEDHAAVGKAVVIVINGSKRPIRNINCWLETRQAGAGQRRRPIYRARLGPGVLRRG